MNEKKLTVCVLVIIEKSSRRGSLTHQGCSDPIDHLVLQQSTWKKIIMSLSIFVCID